MRILLVHTGTSQRERQWHEEVASAAPQPLKVRCFVLTFAGFKSKVHWNDLHLAWRSRHPAMVQAYTALKRAAEEVDVLLFYNGRNIHPDFLRHLQTFNVFCCFDDPESSRVLSRPVAAAFDAVFYGNVASRLQYEHWGCRKLAHLPIFTAPSDVPSLQDRQSIISAPRDNDIILCCGLSNWRKERLRKLAAAFPQARCFGRKWPGAFVPKDQLLDIYGRSRIGWNIHKTTGPINQRLFALPAWNILQICDNKTGLASVFELGSEVIGFDTVDEAIDATNYFLKHEDQRRAIAARAFDRYWREYHAEAIWQTIAQQIHAWRDGQKQAADIKTAWPEEGIEKPRHSTLPYHMRAVPRQMCSIARKCGKSLVKRFGPRLWPVDERFYLSESVSYRPGKTPWLARERFMSHAEDGPDRKIRREALCWAATALIGQARTMLVSGGDMADIFYKYAQVDPQRHINCPQDTPDLPQDLAVNFVWESGTAQDCLDRGLSIRTLAASSLWGFCAEEITALGGTDTLYAKLIAQFETVHFYWLPDPIVPWLEPLPGPLSGISMLAKAQSPL